VGGALASVGDVNGDGFDDMAIASTSVTGGGGGFARDKTKMDKLVYHLGQSNLEFVKDLNPPAAQGQVGRDQQVPEDEEFGGD